MPALTMMTASRLSRLAAAAGLALLLAACGGSSSGKQVTAAVSPSSGGSPAASAAAAGTPVKVTETEFSIEVPKTAFHPGSYTFTVEDKGHATHALEIDGPGVSDKASAMVNGGQSTSLTVTLQKGTYRLYCPVGSHASLGMDTKITVS